MIKKILFNYIYKKYSRKIRDLNTFEKLVKCLGEPTISFPANLKFDDIVNFLNDKYGSELIERLCLPVMSDKANNDKSETQVHNWVLHSNQIYLLAKEHENNEPEVSIIGVPR